MNKNKQVSHSKQETISIIFHAPIKRDRVGYTVADCTVYKQYISQSWFSKLTKQITFQLCFCLILRLKPFLPSKWIYKYGWLSAPPPELCNYHDNHSQQRRDSAGYGKLIPRYSPVKASTEHCCLLKGLCQNSPLPTPLVLTPGPDPPTHC